jgi:polysaccharide pyruvyl transferase WcaK-like protein
MPPTLIADCDSVFDLMGLIAGARLYVGTSLHGAITAVSYGVPVLGLCPSRVRKLAAFLGTWLDEQAYGLAEIGQIDAAFDRVWSRRPTLAAGQIAALQDLAQAHFERLLSFPDGDVA